MKRVWTAAAGMVLMGSGAGCATIRSALSFTEPQVALEEIRVTGLGLTGGTLDLVLDVYNPNDYRLRSTRLELGLDLEDVHFGDALIDKPLDLSPLNHSQVIIPVQFQWSGVGAAAQGLLRRQAIRYGLAGKVIVDTPIGARDVPLRFNGDVPLKKFF